MPNSAALAALLRTYRDEIRWLTDVAEKYQRENRLVATFYFKRAEKLQALIEQYESVSLTGSPFVPAADRPTIVIPAAK